MIGLVNAAGAPESSRIQSVSSDKMRVPEAERSNVFPLLNNERAAQQVLRSAVNTIEFTAAGAAREVPDGEQSDRFDQAELEAGSSQTVGRFLDVTA